MGYSSSDVARVIAAEEDCNFAAPPKVAKCLMRLITPIFVTPPNAFRGGYAPSAPSLYATVFQMRHFRRFGSAAAIRRTQYDRPS